jgi:hypothetical protein
MLLLPAFLTLALASGLPAALGGQIPVVNGVVGGVPPISPAPTSKILADAGISANTPGKLRIKENTGICGMLLIQYMLVFY